MKECFSTPSFSVMLNGAPNGYFKSNSGIFVLTMEFWSITMDMAHASGNIKPMKKK